MVTVCRAESSFKGAGGGGGGGGEGGCRFRDVISPIISAVF